VDFKLVKGHSKQTLSFKRRPLEHLIKRYNHNAKEIRINLHRKDNETNIKYVGYYVVKIKGKITTNSVKELIRIANGRQAMEEYLKDKFSNNHNFIDGGARNVFSNKRVTVSIISCSHGYNHYGIREALLNKNNKGDDCLQCSELEM